MYIHPDFRIGVLLVVAACAGTEPLRVDEAAPREHVREVAGTPEGSPEGGREEETRRQETLAGFRRALASLLEERKTAREVYEAERDEAERDKPGVDKSSKSLSAAVAAMQRYHNQAIDHAGLYEEGGDARRWCVREVLAGLKSDRDYYEEMDLQGVVLWLEYSIGRAYVLAGDVHRACEEGYDRVCDFDTKELPKAAKEWVDKLRLYAFYMKAKSLLDAKRYEKAVETADDMFASPPKGYPSALDDAFGNAAVLIKARALYLKKPPDFQGAIRECKRVIDRNLMPWPNNARQILVRIHDAMEKAGASRAPDERTRPPEVSLADAPSTPALLHQAAIGRYHLAMQERDPDRQRKLLEKAAQGFKDAIAACRREGVPYKTRLEHESAAWAQLGICYSKMQLWYEAGFAFEKVLREFAKDIVGMELAKYRELRGMLQRIRADIKAGKHKPEPGTEINEYVVLFDEAKSLPGVERLLEGVETRLMKSANNLVVAARRRHKETGSDEDARRLEETMRTLVAVDPRKRKFVDFHMGLLRRDAGHKHLKAGRPEEAVAKWKEAGQLFLKAAEARPSVSELGHYLAGESNYRAMVEAMKLGRNDPRRSAEARAFARKALVSYEKFIELANAAPAADKTQAAKRKKRLETVAQAKEYIEKAYGASP